MVPISNYLHRLLIIAGLLLMLGARAAAAEQTEPVSFHRDVRPILQANCQGCHQPAKASGGYVLTSPTAIYQGGESEQPAIVPGKPDESHLLELITPVDGEASMPQNAPPLSEAQIDLIRRWIAAGASDDTPPSTRPIVDAQHPPVYFRPPVITSLDYSPDGKLLAISGFHETLLHNADGSGVDGSGADGSGLVARLVGMSERIESVRFSPDGTKLVVTGGVPAQMGEVQIWDVATRELELSVLVTFDTVYGASWSPDGKIVAFGCTDNSLRAIDSSTGEQVLYQGAHSDWVFDTVFSVDGSHLVSVSRDASAKLIDVPHERFIDNVTSITPGALRGGINAIVRHPLRDEILFGGADGVAKIYRMHRTTKRVIGDDANLLWELPRLPGRIFGVDYSKDGSLIAAGSSFNGAGSIGIYALDPVPKIPDPIIAILVKPTQKRSAAEIDQLKQHFADGVKLVAELSVDEGAIYAVSISPDGSRVAAGGADGQIRLVNTTDGKIVKQFVPVDIAENKPKDLASISDQDQEPYSAPVQATTFDPSTERPPTAKDIVRLSMLPETIELSDATGYAQIIVTAHLASGDVQDVTRLVQLESSAAVAHASPTGLVSAQADGTTTLSATLAGQKVSVPVTVAGAGGQHSPDYIKDVSPILARVGCNAGTCHGAQDGKNGFKLSLRGYDPLLDLRALTDDAAARRINLASPAQSLMLLKPTAEVPHEGGQVVTPESDYYQTLLSWIETGAEFDADAPGVASIEVQPINPIVQSIGARQQMRVVATYTDGSQRDVTREAFVESGEAEVAKPVDGQPGLIEVLRRGEAPVLVRYEGSYAATTITVMGDRNGFTWNEPPANNPIDTLTYAKLERTKTSCSTLCDDYTFVRRVYLDLTGLPPTPEQVLAFIDDVVDSAKDSQTKRDQLIDQLIGCGEYVEHWSNKWADLLQVNSKFLGSEGAEAFRNWIREEVKANTPYDQFAHKILTAAGSNKENPAASYYKILRDPAVTMENTTHLFLATRFNCNKCHDHPFERWTQDQYYQLSAYFSRLGFKADPASGDKKIAGTAVEEAKPLYEIVFAKSEGEMTHLRTGKVAEPKFPFECGHECDQDAPRHEQLAAWITSPGNRYFATSYANRIWAYLTGRGIIEPIDDIRAGNPPTNPELLEWLTQQLIESGFDTQHLIRTICRSRTYQLALSTDTFNEDDQLNYSHARARRLPAEVLYDALQLATGAESSFPGVPKGMRAAALPDVGIKLPDGFLTNLGRPARESACECERTSSLQMGPVMALINGATVGDAINDPKGAIAELVANEADESKLLEKLFLRILSRPAREAEIAEVLEVIQGIDRAHEQTIARFEKYQSDLEPILQQRRQDRQALLAATKVALEQRIESIAPERAALEQQRTERIAAAQQALAEVRAASLEKRLEWEVSHHDGTAWEVLNPTRLVATNGAELRVQEDSSVFVQGPNEKKTTNHIIATSELAGITGVRVEALSDDRLPKKGPGRASDGNFVLSELEFQTAPLSDAANSLLKSWDFAVDAEGWKTHQETTFTHKAGRLVVGHPQKMQRMRLPFDAPAQPLAMDITAKLSTSTRLSLLWKTAENPSFLEPRASGVWAAPGPDGWHTYRVYFHPKAPVTDLRLEFIGGSEEVEVDSVRLVGAEPPKFVKHKLKNAQADFSQQSYSVENAIDGKDKVGNGWAVAPQSGTDHVAIFETPDDYSEAGIGLVEFELMHKNSPTHNLGRFRLSITRAPRPHTLSLPDDLAKILAVVSQERTSEQQKKLTAYFLSKHRPFLDQKAEIAAAKLPLSPDEKVVQLEARIAELSKPMAEDPHFVRLRRAAKLSKEQFARKRLTVTQDVAWALLNSPEFLYNH